MLVVHAFWREWDSQSGTISRSQASDGTLDITFLARWDTQLCYRVILRYAGPVAPIIVTPSPAEDPDDIIEQEDLLVAHAFNESGESDEEESGLEQIV